MSDLTTSAQQQSASYFNLTNNGKSASEILGTSAASSAQSTANEFKNFLQEAVETVNTGLGQTKNTMSGVQGLSQQVSNRTGNVSPGEDISNLYSKNDLLKEVYGEIPSAKPKQAIVALADQEQENTSEDVDATDSTEEVAATSGDEEATDADATTGETEEVAETATAANTEETSENSDEDAEDTDKVAAANDDGEDDESGDIMDLLSNVATLGTIATLLI